MFHEIDISSSIRYNYSIDRMCVQKVQNVPADNIIIHNDLVNISAELHALQQTNLDLLNEIRMHNYGNKK
jgi:hypothetical protein